MDSVKEKNIGVEFLRIIMSWCVVVSHVWTNSAESPVGFIINYTGYAVPVFFVISFYFGQKWISFCSKEKLLQRMKKLIIPYLFWNIVAILYYLIMHHFNFDGNIFLSQLVFGCGINSVMWFQFDLIVVTLIFWLICRLGKGYSDRIFVVLLIFCYYMQYTGANWNIFSPIDSIEMYTLGRIVEVVPMAVAGYFLSKFGIGKKLNDHKVFSVLINILLLIFVFKFNPVRNAKNGFYLQGMGTTIVSLLMFCTFYVIVIPRNVFRKIIEKVASVSAGPYYMHLMISGLVSEYTRIHIGSIRYATFVWFIAVLIALAISKSHMGKIAGLK